MSSRKKNYVKKTQRLIFNFVWDKTERIKRNTLIGDITKGGLNIVDVGIKSSMDTYTTEIEGYSIQYDK